MRTIAFCYWLVYWSALAVSAALCSTNSSTIYVDCINGSDTGDCGLIQNMSCKTMQFIISQRVHLLKTSDVLIDIVPGVCNESGVLRLDNAKTKVHYWSFVGSNK